jgi:2-succinyl-6-hydroxy-2,4-cyclohexadiene-1-carboxylate synthase
MVKKELILLHGFLGHSSEFNHLGLLLAPRFNCHAIDIPPSHCIDTIRQFLHATISHYDRPIVVGYSMGGRLALDFVSHFPTLVSHLVLISASPGIEKQEDRQQRQLKDRQWATKLLTLPFTEFLTQWYQQSLFDQFRMHPSFSQIIASRPQGDVSLLADMLLALSPGVLPSLWHHLSVPLCPITYIYGQCDTAYSNIAHRLNHDYPHITTYGIPDCGHVCHHEYPEKVAEILLDI